MTERQFWQKAGRAVIAVSGAGARDWLDNLVTNDLSPLTAGLAVFAGLLNPQGKLQFEFLVVPTDDGVLLDTLATSAADLVKRLALYRLRAKVGIADVSAEWASLWAPQDGDEPPPATAGSIVFADPRAPGGMWRALVRRDAALPAVADDADVRLSLGLPEAPADYALGDVFPHEANFDRVHGVSFSKGCYVGQEVVARMHNKAVVRRHVVRIRADGDLPLISGSDIAAGTAIIGKVGTTDGRRALAMVRLDRAVEAIAKGTVMHAGGVPAVIDDDDALVRFRERSAKRPVEGL